MHFEDSEGELEPEMLMLPHELAAKILSMRSAQSTASSSSRVVFQNSEEQVRAEEAAASYHLDDDPKVVHKQVRQKHRP